MLCFLSYVSCELPNGLHNTSVGFCNMVSAPSCDESKLCHHLEIGSHIFILSSFYFHKIQPHLVVPTFDNNAIYGSRDSMTSQWSKYQVWNYQLKACGLFGKLLFLTLHLRVRLIYILAVTAGRGLFAFSYLWA